MYFVALVRRIPPPDAIDGPGVPAALRARVLECLRAAPSERPRVQALIEAIGPL